MESAGQTLQPAALVHEAWLRLAGGDLSRSFENRAHFFGAAAEAMRRILIEGARRRSGEVENLNVDDFQIFSPLEVCS